eukprot:TRINITY_DN1223_c0_g1_i2.p1 TRINITY_DN1223_c0_g1~~TRINITY_DN1223_c0_g1_i2.p1  ORF type:complete len:925 (+),score=193.57 TRINITY_DN1223_c0_g1_i2:106-2880(+)
MPSEKATAGEQYILYIEMACNGMFGNPASGGFLSPPDPDLSFTLNVVELAVLDKQVWDLFWDFDVILGMAKELPDEYSKSWQAVTALDSIMNVVYPGDRSTYELGKRISEKFLSSKNGESKHVINASGHCHIDTAWLWTYSETRRKCARSWSSQLTYAEKYKEHVFVASQAQQHFWMKENYPGLFQRMKAGKEKGVFLPTGGTWVEMDCNIPSGESFIRQFLYGQRFFEEEYGEKCTEFWLPDTFGYSSQLPQIVKGAGMEYFLTQKLSWNLINKFPHNSFIWKGLDGTEVLCHFPPADTYCASVSVEEVVYTEKNFKNKGISNNTTLLFGLGDGGGGPQMRMLERLRRMNDVDGLPKVQLTTPHNFFQKLKDEFGAIETEVPLWSGELYFELHRGTYTTHAAVKYGNRKSEFLLRNLEILSSISSLNGYDYNRIEIERLWKLVLLNQFHDVIPGTSIGHVYTDTNEHYLDVSVNGSKLLSEVKSRFFREHSIGGLVPSYFFNSLSWDRSEIVSTNLETEYSQKLDDGNNLCVVTAPSLSFSSIDLQFNKLATVDQNDTSIIMKNEFLTVEFTLDGNLTSIIHHETNNEVIENNKYGNQFVIFDDVPFFWDAWDVMIYHNQKRKNLMPSSIQIKETGHIRVSVEIIYNISDKSKITQTVYLDALHDYIEFDTVVDWYEDRKFLKVEFPVNVSSYNASYSTQFGNVQRPTHCNTSWDMAKFEVCGHHWADISEYNFGVALMNDCKYGYACENNTLRLSLLRSPKRPDDNADMGVHTFKYALLPHKFGLEGANLPKRGYEFNVPLVSISDDSNSFPLIEGLLNSSFFQVDQENLMIDTIKLAEDDDKAMIVRLWETLGGRGTCHLSSSLPIASANRCNLLEEDDEFLPFELFGDVPVKSIEQNTSNNQLSFKYSPFEIISIKLHFE